MWHSVFHSNGNTEIRGVGLLGRILGSSGRKEQDI